MNAHDQHMPGEVVRGRVVSIALLIMGALQPVVVGSLPFAVVAAGVAVGLSLWLRSLDAAEAKDAIILVALLYIVSLVPGIGLWPSGPAIAIGVTALISWRAGRLARWREWLRVGRFDGQAWATIGAVAAVSVVALLLWQTVFDGQLPTTYSELAGSVAAQVAVAGAVGFTVLNGAIEDSIFFGLLLTPMLRYFPPRSAVALTALAFGLAHLHGVPNGIVGVLLAGTWALMLGYLRTRTGGMLATYLAHVVADATIVAMLIPPLLTM
ncbi:CPBP family glutamic-type intramembrane protease [Microbacterium sp. Kw_RZR3]|uniref:CPBP family intramembrane glutamic endopeptidase n=1 Tax=Microbacterium sp. Kw_RZR3 TaxID=3032903 RepID=UPI0023DCACA7|nr:CPBP family intramembrane glutamic endopeptidase [Microbacterium sp. Kw_RZR3]MDF2047076.1 CPBP family glutamic-type intramembrane protease [Microbacterium sp. Kw_RZR3]